MNSILPYSFRFELCSFPRWFHDSTQQQIRALHMTGIKDAQGKEKNYMLFSKFVADNSLTLPGH